jgi:hypothetical protein
METSAVQSVPSNLLVLEEVALREAEVVVEEVRL